MSNVGFRPKLQHTTTVVSDFAASRRFYTEILGLEIAPSGFNHVALAVDDFDGNLAHLNDAGVVYTNLGGSERYYVQTRPDGYWIEITDAA